MKKEEVEGYTKPQRAICLEEIELLVQENVQEYILEFIVILQQE